MAEREGGAKDLRNIRLVAIDLDGTLLSDEKWIPDVNLTAVEQVKGLGVLVSVITGRSAVSAWPIVEAMDPNGPCAFCHGAELWIPKTGEKFVGAGISWEDAALIVEMMEEFGFYPLLFVSNPPLVLVNGEPPPENPYERYLKANALRIRRIEDLSFPVEKVVEVAGMGDVRVWEEMRGSLEEALGSSFSFVLTDVKDGWCFIEVLSAEANKASAFRRVCEIAGIPMENAAYIGDSYPDVEPIRQAGVGVAPANAVAEALLSADMIAPNNNRGAVAWFLKMLVAHLSGKG